MTRVYLSGIDYELGEHAHLLVNESGLAPDTAQLLAQGGVTGYRRTERSAGELAAVAFARTMERAKALGREPTILLISSDEGSAALSSELTRSAIRQNLDILRIPTVYVSGNGCARLAYAVDLARSLVHASGHRAVGVILVDKANPAQSRVDTWGVTLVSDAAASFIVSAEPAGAEVEILGIGISADSSASLLQVGDDRLKTIDTIMDGIKNSTAEALAEASLTPESIEGVITSHVRADVQVTYAEIAGINPELVVNSSTKTFGHCYASDPIIQIAEMSRARKLESGAISIIVTAAATWGGIIVRTIEP